MADSATTRPSLLARIRDPRDRHAWAEFVEIYAPLVYAFACRQGLQDADAADLTQDVLRAVARSCVHLVYDPGRGTFRGWLFTVVRNELRDFLSRRRRNCAGSGDSAVQRLLEQQPAREEDESLWDREYQQRLFTWAAEQVRRDFQESTWQAFWLTAVQGRSGKEAAQQLGITTAAVYLAKRRVMARLKEQIEMLQVEQAWPFEGAQ